MKIRSDSFGHGEPIPAEFAFGRPGDGVPMVFSANRNPQLSWSAAPALTRSFCLICVDSDVPTVFEAINQRDRSIAIDQPRQEFIHWVMADIPAELLTIAAGSCADGVVTGGRKNPPGPAGSRQGVNDYTGFVGDGDYFGYDGPCPPWNDERVHRYHFRLFALGVAKLELPAAFNAADLQRAMRGHVLDEASTYGTYTLNPAVR